MCDNGSVTRQPLPVHRLGRRPRRQGGRAERV